MTTMHEIPEGLIDEPSVLSSDPNERKLARRIRIQRRAEALTRQQKSEEEETVEETPIEKQVLSSVGVLEKLLNEGNEVVTGIKLANDARELERRNETAEKRERLLEVLEEEDKKCMEMYLKIKNEWPNILASKDPLNIHDELNAQNAKCLEILDKKDALIAELKEELANADLKYAEDIQKQNEDIDVLIERMENQIRIMAKAYRHELILIENVMESERKMLLHTSSEKWEALHKKLRDDTAEARETRREVIKEYEEDMKNALIEHQEEYRDRKIAFELEIQNLQQEVQNMKALCLMNIEKLDYNYAVLKRREEENIIVKNQQKRRINKLQDVISGLKKTYVELEESSRLEIQKLTNQILKLHKAILDLEEKSNHLAIINDRKYMQIWDLNIETANKLVDKILTVDKIIHEELLGLEWEPPNETLLKKEDLPSYCRPMCFLKEEKEEAEKRRMISKSYKPATSLEDINLERRLLHHFSKLISDRCDYFIEDTLRDLLSTFSEHDKLLIRLDKIFEALKITSEKELQYLLNFFLPYAYCPVCAHKTVSIPSVCGDSNVPTDTSSSGTTIPEICGADDFRPEEMKLIATVQEGLCCNKNENDNDESVTSDAPDETSTETPPMNDQIVSTCISEGIIEVPGVDGEPKRKLTCDKGHLLTVETKFVSNILTEFVERYEFVKKQDEIIPVEKKRLEIKLTVSRNVSETDITEFWERYRNIFSEDREKVWDNLLVGLKKYHEVLKERHKLNAETEFFRKQNGELRYFLKNYSPETKPSENREELQVLQDIL